MEGQEELVLTNDQVSQMIMIKGKRTKRPRPLSPNGVVAAAVTSSSSSACGTGGTITGGDHEYNYYGNSFTSPTTSGDVYESTEEEEDMANCLILLAQGDHVVHPKQVVEEGLAQNTNMGRAGFYVYECKTCSRTFPSFQALGGHRASHKKPKSMSTASEEKKSAATVAAAPHVITSSTFDELEDQRKQFIKYKSSPPPATPSQVGNKQPKIHECSICGSEFTSGQALGGHMRRHRTAAANSSATTHVVAMATSNDIGTSTKLQRNVLPLDLNLPAPEDYDHHQHHHHHQHRDSKFQFAYPTNYSCLQRPCFGGLSLLREREKKKIKESVWISRSSM